MLTAAKAVELRRRLAETDAEIEAIMLEYFTEYPYIQSTGPTAGIWNIIQLQDACIRTLTEEERKLRRGGK